MINATVSGYLGGNGELKHTAGGSAVLEMSIASKGRKPKDGGEAPTEWVRAKVWGQRAEALASFAQKGRFVSVTGALEVQRFVGQNGPTSKVELNVSEIDFGPQVEQQQAQQGPPPGYAPPQQQQSYYYPPQQHAPQPTPQGYQQSPQQAPPQGQLPQFPPPGNGQPQAPRRVVF